MLSLNYFYIIFCHFLPDCVRLEEFKEIKAKLLFEILDECFRLNSEMKCRMDVIGAIWSNHNKANPVRHRTRYSSLVFIHPEKINYFFYSFPTGFPVKPSQSNGCDEPPISYGPLAHAHAITSASVGARAVHHLAITGLPSHLYHVPCTRFPTGASPIPLQSSLLSSFTFSNSPPNQNHDLTQKKNLAQPQRRKPDLPASPLNLKSKQN